MGREFHDEWPAVRESFDRLEDRTDRPLRELCFRAEATRLRSPRNAQPALFAVGAAVAAAAVDRYGCSPDLVAGHSLGHLTAGAHAGLFGAGDGIELVAERGGAMEHAANGTPGEMVAVLLADPDAVWGACAPIDGVAVAAYNTDRQTVISGTAGAVATARDTLDGRCRTLAVDAPFHSPVMEPAVAPIGTALRNTPMQPADVPVVSDVSATVYRSPETGRSELLEQVLAPVDWVAVMGTLRQRGVDRVVEFPPAGTLSAFVSRTAPEIAVETVETPADAAAVFG